ncbi:MAG: hypothetical protein WCS51_04180 [Bacilli bacterium]|nr:hypothetical protein [Bacilli bacterium]
MKKFVCFVSLFVSGIILMGAGTIGDSIYSSVNLNPSFTTGLTMIIVGIVMAVAGGILMLIFAFRHSK